MVNPNKENKASSKVLTPRRGKLLHAPMIMRNINSYYRCRVIIIATCRKPSKETYKQGNKLISNIPSTDQTRWMG
jgi:hypothetical protein